MQIKSFLANCQNSNNMAACWPKLKKIKGVQRERREGPFILFQGPKLPSSYLNLLLRKTQLTRKSKFYPTTVTTLTFGEILQIPNQLRHCLQKTQISLEDPLTPIPGQFRERKSLFCNPVKRVENLTFGDDFSQRFWLSRLVGEVQESKKRV